VAGKRKGLAGKQSGLFYEFVRIVDELLPGWIVFENVAGLLSSHEGRDFACVLGELTGFFPEVPEEGWRTVGVCSGPKRSIAWSLLDSRWYGVAQRRRRVFIVGGPGGASGYEVLSVAESMCGDTAPGGKEKEDIAGTVEATAGRRRGAGTNPGLLCAGTLGGSSQSGGFRTTDLDNMGAFIPSVTPPLLQNGSRTEPESGKTCLVPTSVPFASRSCKHHATSGINESPGSDLVFLKGTDSDTKEGHLIPVCLFRTNADGDVMSQGDRSAALTNPKDGCSQIVAFSENQRSEVRQSDYVPNLSSGGGKPGQGYPAVQHYNAVRRLTPTEFERLQGFPDGFTAVGKAADSPRYKALGNAVTVNVGEWIAGRIMGYINE
jgi:DNA (cytosine-5)-methyltransferase 1